VAGLVEQGLGVSLVPELTLFQFRLLDLAAIPLFTQEHTRPILVVKRKDEALSIAAQGMLELIERHIALERHK
jgi:LysR family carnitine catabolism transcriptional activator